MYLCVSTFWTSPAHFNNPVIILITIIILVTIIVIRNVHSITSLLHTSSFQTIRFMKKKDYKTSIAVVVLVALNYWISVLE